MHNKAKKIILLLGDIIILYLTLYLTLLVRYWQLPSSQAWQNHFWPFSIIFLGWLLIFYISNLYNLHLAVNNAKFFGLTARSLIIAGLLSAAFFYLNPQIGIAPKTNLVIYIFIFVFLFYFWRQLFNWLLKSYLPKNNIAIIGLNNQVKELARELGQNPHLGLNIALIIDDKTLQNNKDYQTNVVQPSLALDEKELSSEQKTLADISIIYSINQLKEKITEKKITTIILTANPHQSIELRNILFSCLPLKINFISLPNFYEMVTGKIPIEAINQMWFLENLSEGSKSWFDAFKRTYDILFSFLIFLLTSIFWILIGLIIKLESKGPIFFKQTRTGQNNQPFTMIKFRTMSVSNDLSPTKDRDTRITRFGRFLRKTRIDELPQVLNILTGSMSFVGPRPERPELIKQLEKNIPFYGERMLVKPGLTGWDQISGEYHSPSQEDSLKKLQYDLFYIKNRSVYLDLSIILKTIATVLSKGGI